MVRSGIKGEEEAAYHINFALKDSKTWVAIHDLRLKCNGRVAQMDHLLIDRFLELYVIESKGLSLGTKRGLVLILSRVEWHQDIRNMATRKVG